MTARITGRPPDHVGDLPQFTITYTAPVSSPGATPSTVTVVAMKPDGTELAPEQCTGSGLDWVYIATQPIDVPGTWRWKVTASGGLVDVTELAATIPATKFT